MMYSISSVWITSVVKDDNKIFSKEQVLEVNVGIQYNIVCDSYGEAKWFFQKMYNAEKKFEVLLVSKEPVLKFKKVKYIHSGYYFCYGVYQNKENHFIAMRTLKVYGMLS